MIIRWGRVDYQKKETEGNEGDLSNEGELIFKRKEKESNEGALIMGR